MAGGRREWEKLRPGCPRASYGPEVSSFCSSRPVSLGLAWVRTRGFRHRLGWWVVSALSRSLPPSFSFFSSFLGPWIPLKDWLAFSSPYQVLPSQTDSLASLSLSTVCLSPNTYDLQPQARFPKTLLLSMQSIDLWHWHFLASSWTYRIPGSPSDLLKQSAFFLYLPHPRHMEFPRPGIESEPQLQPTPQLQQCQILLTPCAKPGSEPTPPQQPEPLKPDP